MSIQSDQDHPGFESLHRRAIIGMRISAWLGFAAICVPGLIALALLLRAQEQLAALRWQFTLLTIAALALVLLTGWHYAARRFARTRFRLDAGGLEIHRGVWWRSQIRVPRSRVQHTDVHQGPLDRRWGLADLTVFTAGTESSSIRLPGLPAERALALRDALLQGHDQQL